MDQTRDRWHLVPIVGWLRTYDRTWLRGDLVAGIAVAALIVPKNLGYAGIAGIPLENGLYAAAAGAILYAVFGTSRQISTGPSSGLAAVAASAVVAAKITGTQDVASFVATITLASGVLFLVLAVFRMGWIAQFLSRAVVTGFLFGAAIDVVIGELPEADGNKCLGLESDPGTPLVDRLTRGHEYGDTGRGPRLAGSHLRAAGDRTPDPRGAGPGGRRAVGDPVSSTSAARGVALVGEVPRGLPTPALPKWSLVSAHAGTIALGGRGTGIDRVLADRRRLPGIRSQASLPDRHQPGIGGSGHVECRRRPVSGDARVDQPLGQLPQRPFRSTLGPWPPSRPASIVLLTLLILAPLFSKLPKPVLAALIIEAVVMGMMDVPEMRRLFRVKRFDFWIAVVAVIGTLVFGVLAGVIIGIGLSLLWLISVATRPSMPLLGHERGTQVYRELDEHPADEQIPGVVVLRLDGGLFFATSDALEDRVREVALSTPDIKGIVLDCEGIDFIDSQGSSKLGEVLDLTDQAGVSLRLARVKPAVDEVLRRDGFARTTRWTADTRQRAPGGRGADPRVGAQQPGVVVVQGSGNRAHRSVETPISKRQRRRSRVPHGDRR